VQRFHRHASAQIGLAMRFALYLPAQALAGAQVPLPVFLAGLSCTEETFAIKAGARGLASALDLALLMPDTSPRAAGLVGEADSWDFGGGAGFYLDVTQAPWAAHWRMER
jgi:S-formylglutathione hydrolase